MSYTGTFAQRFERIEQLVYPAVGGVNIVGSDVFPDRVQITFNVRS
jgi:hypothetical protein